MGDRWNMYSDISVVHMKYNWQKMVDELVKKPYITMETVSEDFKELVLSKPRDNYGAGEGTKDGKYYQSLVLMAIADAIEGGHVFIGMIDLRQDLNLIIHFTEQYVKKKEKIFNDEMSCPECGGHGQFGFTDEDGMQRWNCIACQGSGWIPRNPSKCTGFALCMHCSSERRVDWSQQNNNRAFKDYCFARRERVKSPKDETSWCPSFSLKIPVASGCELLTPDQKKARWWDEIYATATVDGSENTPDVKEWVISLLEEYWANQRATEKESEPEQGE